MRGLSILILAGTLTTAFSIAKKEETTSCERNGTRMEMTTKDYRVFSSFQVATSFSYTLKEGTREKSSGTRLNVLLDDNVERGQRITQNFCSTGRVSDITKIKFGGP